MDVPTLIGHVGPVAATLLVSTAGSVVPFAYIELFLPVAVALVPAGFPIWTLGITAAVGQMVGKCALYWSAAAASKLPTRRRIDPRRLADLNRRMADMNPWTVPGFTFASALCGIPPFILVAIVAGAVRLHFGTFLIAGFAGRAVRLVAVAMTAAGLGNAIL